MTARIASGVLVAALRRRAEAAGGTATVLARGDDGAGAVLLVLAERGEARGLVERSGDCWAATGPADPGDIAGYLARRRRSDPDLWAVELDVADAARIAQELLA